MKSLRSGVVCLAASLITGVIVSGCSTGSPDKKELAPKDKAQLLLNVATAALSSNDAIGALQNLQEAEALDPKNPNIHFVKALARSMRRDSAGAIASAQRATQLKPDYSEAYNLLGKLYIDSGKLAEAEAPLLKATSDPLFREGFKAETNLGVLYYRQGKYSLAQKHLEEAVNQNQDLSCVAHYYLGHVYLRDNHYKQAISNYDQATRRLCSNFVDAHLALAITYERAKDFSKARKKFLDIAQAFPNSSAAEQAADRLKNIP